MTDEERIVELLRAANPVRDHRDAMRVVRETDPLWHTIQARLDDEPTAHVAEEAAGQDRRRKEDHDMRTETAPRKTRRWIGVAAGVAAAVIAIAAVGLVRAGGDGGSDIDYVGGEPDQLPSHVVPPEDVAAVLGVEFDTVDLQMGAGLAPVDCTATGPVEREEEHSYGAPMGERGLVAVTVARFADAETGSRFLEEVHDDIQDCDRAEHPSFVADFEAVTDVDAGDRSFVLSTIADDDRRECFVWTQVGDRITYTVVRGVDPAPSPERCAELATLAGEAMRG